MKRSQGRKKSVPKNFRTRYFCLTNRELRYAKKKGDSPLCTIPSHELLAVERVDDGTFGGMKFVSALVDSVPVLGGMTEVVFYLVDVSVASAGEDTLHAG